MKLPNPWKCDECGATKTATNHWFIGLPSERYDLGRETESMREFMAIGSGSYRGTVIVAWDEALAGEMAARHLCGIECAQKHAGRELAKVYGNEVPPAREGARP